MEKVERGRDDKVEGRNEGEKGERLKRREEKERGIQEEMDVTAMCRRCLFAEGGAGEITRE